MWACLFLPIQKSSAGEHLSNAARSPLGNWTLALSFWFFMFSYACQHGACPSLSTLAAVDDDKLQVSDRLKRGDFFGELALLSSDKRAATVSAPSASIYTCSCCELHARYDARPLSLPLMPNPHMKGHNNKGYVSTYARPC